MVDQESELKLKEMLKEDRRRVVKSIVIDGLLPPSRLKQIPILKSRGHDAEDDEVLGNIIEPEATDEDIHYLLYPSGSSVFPVVIEREERGIPDSETELSEKSHASFLVLCKANQIREHAEEIIEETNEAGEALGFPDGIQPKDFELIIFPKMIWDSISDLHVLQNYSIKIVNDSVRKELYNTSEHHKEWEKYPAIVPNYEAAIKDVARSINEPYWLHAVRLPTVKDL